MKKAFIFVLFLGILGFSFSVDSEQSTQYFIQFKINSISTNAEAMAIDQKMKQRSGIFVTRTDYLTSTYYCILNAGIDYTEADFENWFGKLGYEISCFHRGTYNVDQVLSPHSLKDCQE